MLRGMSPGLGPLVTRFTDATSNVEVRLPKNRGHGKQRSRQRLASFESLSNPRFCCVARFLRVALEGGDRKRHTRSPLLAEFAVCIHSVR